MKTVEYAYARSIVIAELRHAARTKSGLETHLGQVGQKPLSQRKREPTRGRSVGKAGRKETNEWMAGRKETNEWMKAAAAAVVHPSATLPHFHSSPLVISSSSSQRSERGVCLEFANPFLAGT